MSYELPKIITNARRNFLSKGMGIVLSTFTIPKYCFGSEEQTAMKLEGQNPSKKKDFEVFVERYGKQYTVAYADGSGQIYQDGYEYLSRIFGDYHEFCAINMDVGLFNMLSLSQRYLENYNYRKPWIATSGYRTEKTNRNTEGAAQFSMHIYGRATDGKFQGLNPSFTGKLLRFHGGSGIGIYNSFTHADTGRERTWVG